MVAGRRRIYDAPHSRNSLLDLPRSKILRGYPLPVDLLDHRTLLGESILHSATRNDLRDTSCTISTFRAVETTEACLA